MADLTKHSDGVEPVATKSLAQSRRLRQWAVSYSTTVECDYGYEHEVNSILVGLETKAEAKQQAIELGGRVKQDWFTPRISDEEISQLNEMGVPVERSPYGLTFTGMAVAISDSPDTLDDIRQLYELYRVSDLQPSDPDTNKRQDKAQS